MKKLLLILILLTACDEDMNNFFFGIGMSSSGGGGSGFSALSGEASFAMNDIPQESLTPPLYLAYDTPAQGNCPLLVYMHGWGSGGGINGAFATAGINYLKSQGIAILGVGMRGRNTGASYANDPVTVEEYRDASALEVYDIYASINHFVNNIAAPGQINTNKIFLYGVSGGGGNSFGFASRFPDFASVIVSFYGIAKYGTYTGDPHGEVTSWYSDDLGFQGQIQQAVGGAPSAVGSIDSYYLNRDHARGVKNMTGKLHMYHDTGDVTVKELQSALVKTYLDAASFTNYVYHKSTNGLYDHGHHALDITYYDGSFAMEWLSDALTLTKQAMPNSGTIHVPGFVKTADWEVWIKKFRKNNTATPKSQAYTNQGKAYAATVAYNTTNETFQWTPLIPSTSDQFYFANIVKGSKSITALVSASDVVTLKPKTLNQKPLSLNYNCKAYYNFSDATDGYVLDDASKVSNVFDLTGNNNLAFQQTRATRASIVSGSLDNGVMYLSGTAGTLATNVDLLTFTGAFTFVLSFDPDAATVASLNDFIVGRAAGGASSIGWGTFSGKVQVQIKTETGTLLANATPANSNVGKQAWYFRRDASNNVFVKCINSTATYDYGNIGTITGTFDWRVLGAAASTVKGFAGKIYRVAAYAEDIGDTDATSILTNWYAN